MRDKKTTCARITKRCLSSAANERTARNSMYTSAKRVLSSRPTMFKPVCLVLRRFVASTAATAAVSSDTPVWAIRNFGVLAHIDAGKTTTSERMLYYGGVIKRAGDVHDGNTVMDYLPVERERGITVNSAAITFPWSKHELTLIDTPGHVDFSAEVERCMRVLDGAIVVLDSVKGVEAQTITVWRNADRYPRDSHPPKIGLWASGLALCLLAHRAACSCGPWIIRLYPADGSRPARVSGAPLSHLQVRSAAHRSPEQARPAGRLRRKFG